MSTSTASRTPLPSSFSPIKRKTMSITQTYLLAHTARSKLSSEAARADHNLRLLVGHANLLDGLMLELAQAEQEQESWFNNSVKAAAPSPKEPRHIQWADATIVEEAEEDWQAEDADSSDSDDSDFEDDDIEMANTMSLTRVSSSSYIQSIPQEESEEEFEEDDEEDYASLSLARIPSHSPTSPPELSLDSEDDSSEDETMPPSPPSTHLPTFSEKQRQQIATTSLYDSKLSTEDQQSFFNDGYYLPSRASTPSVVTSVLVY